MDFINQLPEYLKDFAVEAETVYHVNPWVFGILFFGSALPLYYGYYRIGHSALKIENKKLKRKTLDKRELKVGTIISVISWWIPYVYVIIFGKLPLYLWLMFFAFVALMGAFFVRTLGGKIKKAKEFEKTDV